MCPRRIATNQADAGRWIVSHVWRYKYFSLVVLFCYMCAWVLYTQAQVRVGQAAAAILQPTTNGDPLLQTALTILVLLIMDGCTILVGGLAAENVASRVATDAREELYISLLGKSQTFHDRQRVGDIMARATEDVNRLSDMVTPGSTMIFESVLGMIVAARYDRVDPCGAAVGASALCGHLHLHGAPLFAPAEPDHFGST